MLTDIQARIDYYAHLAELATDDDELLKRIIATLEDIRAEVEKMRLAADRLYATLGGNQ